MCCGGWELTLKPQVSLSFPLFHDAWLREVPGVKEVDLRGDSKSDHCFDWVVGPKGGSFTDSSVFHSCPASRQKALSLVSCFAGGVFLATCLLDLLPDYLGAIDEALAALHVTVSPGHLHVTLCMWTFSHTLQERWFIWICLCVTL